VLKRAHHSLVLLTYICLFCASGAFCQAVPAPADTASAARTFSIDVKDTDIQDVIRIISRGYSLNIIIDNDISGKITLHLTDVPVMKGLETLARSQGLVVVQEGNLYRIRKDTGESRISIRFQKGLLTVDVTNADVVEFIKEIAAKTGISIVPDSRVTGKVSGKLYEVPIDDGLRAILEGNGYKVIKTRNIYRIEQSENLQAGRGERSFQSIRAGQPGNELYVDFNNGLLTLNVSNGNLSDVIKAIAEQSGMEIVTYGSINDLVNARLENIPITEAFALLLGGTMYTFVQKDNVILIGDRNSATPSGQALSKSEMVHLQHLKADEVVKILPKNIPADNVKIVKEQNALLFSGTSEDIVMAREFLKTVDLPTPQVIIDAIIIEYKRNMDRDFGFEFGYDGGKTGSNHYSFPELEFNRKGTSTKNLWNELFPASSIISGLPDNFYMSLKLLESQGKAKVLAQPSITVLNGNKASIKVGQTQYFKVVSGTSDNPTYRFEPISFGINLDITPWISQGGQINAEIVPEVSNNMGNNEDGYPEVFSRNISTTVRLENGSTLVLGGLLRSDEQINNKKVPILGDIPIIGNIFKTTRKVKIQTNLVIYITPHVIQNGDTVNLSDELKKFNINEQKGFRENFFDDAMSPDSVTTEKKAKKSLRKKKKDIQ
jgi:type IV pilus assembly protein PilQ